MSNLLAYVTPSAFDFATIFSTVTKFWYFYLALLVIIVGLVLFFIFVKPIKRDKLTHTQRLVYIAVLTAICTVANCFLTIPITPNNSLSFTITVCFIAGYLLGAKAGFVVGFVGDLIGCIIFPQGVYLPLMSVASGLYGMIPGLLFSYFNSDKKFNNYLKTIISAILIYGICSLVLNSISLWLLYSSKAFSAYLIVRLPFMSINAVMNCALCLLIVGVLPRILPNSKFVFEGYKKSKVEETESENNVKS